MAFTSTVVEQDRDLFLIERGPCHYEVWRIQRLRAAILPDGTEILDGWRPPSTSEWGTHGWSFCCTPRSERLARGLFGKLTRHRLPRNADDGVAKRGVKGGVLEPAKGQVAPPL